MSKNKIKQTSGSRTTQQPEPEPQQLTAEQAAAQWQAYAKQVEAERDVLRVQVAELGKQIEKMSKGQRKDPAQPKIVEHRVGYYDSEHPRKIGGRVFPSDVVVAESIEAARKMFELRKGSALPLGAKLRYL